MKTKEATMEWIDLVDPSRDDVSAEALGIELHPVVIDEILAKHQLPKVEHHGGYDVVVLKPAIFDSDTRHLEVGESSIVVGDDFLITVRQGTGADALPGLGPEGGRKEIDPDVRNQVTRDTIEAVVDCYRKVLHQTDDLLSDAEARVFSSDFINQSSNIYYLKRAVLFTLALAEPTKDVVDVVSSRRGKANEQGDGIDNYMRSSLDHIKRVVAGLTRNSDLLTEILAANHAQIGIVQNNEMRRMTAWATIFLAPTLLAGVWGMNFRHMPELDWEFGYIFAVAVMAVVSLGLYLNFRRLDWVGPTPDDKAPV